MSTCNHASLSFDVSKHAEEAKYRRPNVQQRSAATQPSGRLKAAKASSSDGLEAAVTEPSASTFPAPLVLPGDELSWDPKYPPQSLRSWLQLRERNQVSSERRTIYVVPPPTITKNVAHFSGWTVPVDKHSVSRPNLEHVVSYLRALYLGLPVKTLSPSWLRFVPWDDETTKKSKFSTDTSSVALETQTEAIQIRTREHDGFYKGQLNLNDLLDVALSILPKDAYALLMLVNHDLYEDDDDDFCCGRAYGGSRVAVVSTARYNPVLDVKQKVEVQHAWPTSHCKEYIDVLCKGHGTGRILKKRKVTSRVGEPDERSEEGSGTAMQAAVSAATTLQHPAAESDQSLTNLWLGRICKTASHELGHCFGIDHCVYYSCLMQGTAGLSEDARQPPFLCPIDTAKVLRATGSDEKTWLQELLRFCERFEDDRLFAAFAAWLKVRLDELLER